MLSYEQARNCYEEVLTSSLDTLLRDLFIKACDYARIRAGWPLLTREQRVAADQNRTLAHNAFIDSVNILSRNQAKAGEDNSWHAVLTNERKQIGDFACYIHLFLSLEAR